MPEKITIDELAVMVRDGFIAIEKRLDVMEKRLGGLTNQVTELAMDAKKHREITNEIDHRLRRIEQELDIARKQASLTDARVSHLESALLRR